MKVGTEMKENEMDGGGTEAGGGDSRKCVELNWWIWKDIL